MVMGTLMLNQAVPFPGKPALRRSAALADAEVSRAEWVRMRRQLAADVRSMYADLYAMDEMAAALRATRESLDLLESSAASRYTAGLSMQADLIEVQLQRSRVNEQLDDIAASRAAMTAKLNSMLDRIADTPIRTTAPPSRVAAGDPGAPDSAAVANAPDVVIRRQAVEAARFRLAIARREAWPDIVAGVEYGWRRSLPPMLTATLGLELPVWKGRKQDAEARAAAHDLEMARQDLRMAVAAARGEAARLAAARDVAARQVELYRAEIVPRSELILDAARATYAAGAGGSVREAMEAYRMVLEALAGRARREADLYKAEAALAALAGTDPAVPREGDAK